jgi:ribonuclease HII
MTTGRSASVRIYRRASARFVPLREALARGDFRAVTPPDPFGEWECVDGAGTRVRCAGSIVLVEARDDEAATAFDAQFRMAFPSEGDVPDGGAPPELVTWIAGSDESGKGDRSQALAVAAVAVPVELEDEALVRGVRDSKVCTRAEIAELARWIVARCPHAVETVERDRRDEALKSHGGNETRLLAAMHARVLVRVHGASSFTVARVDRFAPNRPVAAILAGSLQDVIVDECARGERHVACAAASIVARAAVIGFRA